MKFPFYLLAILLFIPVIVSAQTEKTGRVEYVQDARIDDLLRQHIEINKTKGTIPGWRIHLKSTSGNNSKKEASDLKAAFLNRYPDIPAYLSYQSPNFKVRVGDFRTKIDAYKFYKELKSEFTSAYIIRDDIMLPRLD